MIRLDPRAILSGQAYSTQAIKHAASSGKTVLIVDSETADWIERSEALRRQMRLPYDDDEQPRLIPAD